MIKSRLCDLIGIKYPIIQAGMGPFSNNNLCVATANAGVLGLLSTSGVFNKDDQPWIYNDFVKTGEADPASAACGSPSYPTHRHREPEKRSSRYPNQSC